MENNIVWIAKINGKDDSKNKITKIGYREIEHKKYKYAGCFNDADINIHIYVLANTIAEIKEKITKQWGNWKTFEWLK